MIEALTESEVIEIELNTLNKVKRKEKALEVIIDQNNKKFLSDLVQLLADHILLNKTQHYMKIMVNRKDIVNELKVKEIASFLGIHPNSLSRIRKLE